MYSNLQSSEAARVRVPNFANAVWFLRHRLTERQGITNSCTPRIDAVPATGGTGFGTTSVAQPPVSGCEPAGK
jgi:hypothetical protein